MKRLAVIFLFFNRIASIFLLPIPETGLTTGVNAEFAALLHLGITGSTVDWRNAFGLLAQKFLQDEKDLNMIKPLLALRKRIEMFEILVAPELNSPRNVFKDMSEALSYHEAKWKKILNKTNDPAVKRLIDLLDAEKIDHDLFCRRIGTFYIMASSGIHVPKLSSYQPEEMKTILEKEFEIFDPITINIAMILMKL